MCIKPEPTPARPTVYTTTCPSKRKIQISYQRLKRRVGLKPNAYCFCRPGKRGCFLGSRPQGEGLGFVGIGKPFRGTKNPANNVASVVLLELNWPCWRPELVMKGVVTATNVSLFSPFVMVGLIWEVVFGMFLADSFWCLLFQWEVEECVWMEHFCAYSFWEG